MHSKKHSASVKEARRHVKLPYGQNISAILAQQGTLT